MGGANAGRRLVREEEGTRGRMGQGRWHLKHCLGPLKQNGKENQARTPVFTWDGELSVQGLLRAHIQIVINQENSIFSLSELHPQSMFYVVSVFLNGTSGHFSFQTK